MDGFSELISRYHEAEFGYNGTAYVLQPEVNDDKTYLVIWDCTPDASKCIAKLEIGVQGDTPREGIDSILSDENATKPSISLHPDFACGILKTVFSMEKAT